MSSSGGGELTGPLSEAIDKELGGFEGFFGRCGRTIWERMGRG